MLSTLNFKTSLFEGILDNGEDTIFLEDSKFDKIMESIKETVEVVGAANADTPFVAEESEEKIDEATALQGDGDATNEAQQEMPGSGLPEENPDVLVQQGVSFLSGLARTLASPEATRKLVDSLVEEDKETGRTTLRIQVPDKESVVGVLSMLGKLFNA